MAYLAERPLLRRKLREDLRGAPDLAALSRSSCVGAWRSPRSRRYARCDQSPRAILGAELTKDGGALGLAARTGPDRPETRIRALRVDGSLAAALADELPINKRDGGFIREKSSAQISTSSETSATAAASSSPACKPVTPMRLASKP